MSASLVAFGDTFAFLDELVFVINAGFGNVVPSSTDMTGLRNSSSLFRGWLGATRLFIGFNILFHLCCERTGPETRCGGVGRLKNPGPDTEQRLTFEESSLPRQVY